MNHEVNIWGQKVYSVKEKGKLKEKEICVGNIKKKKWGRPSKIQKPSQSEYAPQFLECLVDDENEGCDPELNYRDLSDKEDYTSDELHIV